MTPLLAQRSRVDRGFERLYRRYVADVYRYSLAVLRNPADAEDVTQTTFLNAYRAFQRGERPTSPQHWLIKIAHNVCRQRFRNSARRPQEVAFDDDVGTTIVEEEQGPTATDIQRALGELAFNQRAALVMRELEGRSYADIAEVLGLSVSAVETLIFRARRALREQLEGALTCHEAELAISKQLDKRLPRSEKGALRAHLRRCPECATFARSQRAQRSALRGALVAVPLPTSLASFFGGSTVGAGVVGAKAGAALVAAAVIAGGVGYEGIQHAPWRAPSQQRAGAPAVQRDGAAASASAVQPVGAPNATSEANVPGPDTDGRAVVPARKQGRAGGKSKTIPGPDTEGKPVKPARDNGRHVGQTKAKSNGSSRAAPRGQARGRSSTRKQKKANPGRGQSQSRSQSSQSAGQPRGNSSASPKGKKDAPAVAVTVPAEPTIPATAGPKLKDK
jgi:RNA polymerase sigma factor (sigma-70 family)